MDIGTIIILLISGLGAGIITGFIGASAVAFMAGLLMIFTSYTPYIAIGLALITDFFAATTSAYFYKKSNNIRLNHGIIIAIIATFFALIAGFFSRYVPHPTLGNGFGIVILITGINFIVNPLKFKNGKLIKYFEKRKVSATLIFGTLIGILSGVFGVGGGIFILLTLLYIFDYPIKSAIGTSLFIMAFIALAGGLGHFIKSEIPFESILLTAGAGIVGAIISSKYANKIKEKTLFQIIGAVLIVLSITIMILNF